MFTSLRVQGYRSIEDTGDLALAPITLIIGPNNSGKSSLLRAAYLVQQGAPFVKSDIRIGHSRTEVQFLFNQLPKSIFSNAKPPHGNELTDKSKQNRVRVLISAPDAPKVDVIADSRLYDLGTGIGATEPNNLVFPILSTRRQSYYQEQAGRNEAISVGPMDSNLVSRMLPLVSSSIQEALRFRELSKRVLGVEFDIFADDNRMQHIGVQVDRFTTIPLEAMGAGLSGALSLLIGISGAREKLFILEEPEDGLHPIALKQLLDMIAESSQHNQFLISTHSNIVLTRLASHSDHVGVIRVTSDQALPPTSKFEEVTGPAERLQTLQDLGYGLADLDLGEGWIIFEEASAERLIRQYLAPWFAPGLVKLRTVGARGVSRVAPLFQDFREMFLFAHLELAYRNRAWVIVDGDEAGVKLVNELRAEFPDWEADRFQHWPKGAIERYYPDEFKPRVESAFSIKDKVKRKAAKSALFDDLLKWISMDEARARKEFEESAAEVIALLKKVERALPVSSVSIPEPSDVPITH